MARQVYANVFFSAVSIRRQIQFKVAYNRNRLPCFTEVKNRNSRPAERLKKCASYVGGS